MDWAMAGASLLGSTLSTIGGLYTNAQNRRLQEKINKQQQANFDKQFNYQQYLNENQHQIETKDLTQAGINPIVGAGGQLNTFNGNANLDSSGQENPIDTTAFTQLAQLKHDSKERAADRENAKEIAKINAQTAKYTADKNAETSTANTQTTTQTQQEIARQQEENKKTLAEAENQLRERMAKADREMKAKLQKEAEEAQANLQESAQRWQDSDDHRQSLRLIQDAYNRLAEDSETRKYLNRAKVTINGTPYTLEDAIQYYQMHQEEFDTNTQAATWGLQQIRDSFGSLLNAINPWAGKSDSGNFLNDYSKKKGAKRK